MNKEILVIGGAGYIGSACVDLLIKNGHHVTVFDNFSTGQKEKILQTKALIQGDIRVKTDLEKVFVNRTFDSVIHLAAYKSVEESEQDPEKYFTNNVLGTLNILSLIAKYQIPQIIFSSTAAVYTPTPTSAVYTETSPLGGISVYGHSKEIAEQLINDYVRTKKIPRAVIFRYFNVAGDCGLNYKENNPRNIFPILARACANNTLFTVYGTDYETPDGTCIRDYIHVTDVAKAHVRALAYTDSATFNLGTSTGFSVKELIQAFEQIAQKQLNTVYAPRRSGDTPIVLADAKLAEKELTWKATQTLEDMVRSTLAVYGVI